MVVWKFEPGLRFGQAIEVFRSVKTNGSPVPFLSYSPGDSVTVKEMIRTVLTDRSRSQPIGNASAGSVFSKPVRWPCGPAD